MLHYNDSIEMTEQTNTGIFIGVLSVGLEGVSIHLNPQPEFQVLDPVCHLIHHQTNFADVEHISCSKTFPCDPREIGAGEDISHRIKKVIAVSTHAHTLKRLSSGIVREQRSSRFEPRFGMVSFVERHGQGKMLQQGGVLRCAKSECRGADPHGKRLLRLVF